MSCMRSELRNIMEEELVLEIVEDEPFCGTFSRPKDDEDCWESKEIVVEEEFYECF